MKLKDGTLKDRAQLTNYHSDKLETAPESQLTKLDEGISSILLT